MAFNFPDAPVEDQVFTPSGGPTYVYKSPRWIIKAVIPGGADTQVQFNDAGVFSGDTGLTYNKTTDALTVSGAVTSTSTTTGNFIGPAASVNLAPATGGTIYLRPSGPTSTTGQTTIDSAGNMVVGGSFNATNNVSAGVVSISGSGTTGINIFNTGKIRSGVNSSAAFDHHEFYNTNAALVGYIRTTGTATAFGTSSDANLKNVHGDYDPAEAIAIIRADPVQVFDWISDGASAVGWVAQNSYAVDPDLAMPPPAPEEGKPALKFGEEGYVPWGIDYGRRTPYLWAALTWALDKIEALEARIAALEAG